MTSQHFTGKITVTQHAVSRAICRMGATHKNAEQLIRDNLRQARMVDDAVISKEYPTSARRMFAHKGYVFIVAQDEDTVITVLKVEPSTEIRSEMEKHAQRIITRIKKEASREIRRLSLKRGELAVQLAETELKHLRTNVTRLKRRFDDEIAKLRAEITQLSEEIEAINIERTAKLKAVSAYLL